MDPMATINEALLRTNRARRPQAAAAPAPTAASTLPPGQLTYPEAPEVGGNWASQGTSQVPVGAAGATTGAQRAPISGVFNSTPVPTQSGIAGAAAGRPPIRAGAPGGSGIDLLQQAAAAVAARGR